MKVRIISKRGTVDTASSKLVANARRTAQYAKKTKTTHSTGRTLALLVALFTGRSFRCSDKSGC